MKKVLSVLLVFAVMLSAVAVGMNAFAQDATTKFAVASDLHYCVPEEELEVIIEGDELFWHANRRAALENESSFIIDEFLNQCAADDNCDFVLIPGDIVNDGRIVVQQHLDMAEKFKKFEEETGKPVYVINGNHDNGAGENDFKYDDFIENYYQFGYDEAIATLEGTCSYVAELDETYRLIALDSCDPTKSTEDGMSTEKVQWVLEQAEKAYEAGKYPILMMHHNLLDHLPVQRILSRNFIVRFHYTTAELFANAGIKIVFTGHEHCSDATSYTSTQGNKIYDFATTALTMYPLEYRLFSLTDNEITYESKAISSIDIGALTSTVSGYTDPQIDLMISDFNEDYAYGFLKSGVQYRLAKGMRMEEIGISEGEPFYNLVYTAVTGLTDLLEMPLYGENSVQERALEYGIKLPFTSYKTGWDLVTDLVAAHYGGEEDFPLDSDPISVFFKVVALILRDDLAGISDDVILGAVHQLLGLEDGITTELTQLTTQIMGRATAVEYLLLAVASPILYEFTTDNDGVNDNRGVLSGYAVDNNIENIIDNVQNFFAKIAKYFSLMFAYLAKIFHITVAV